MNFTWPDKDRDVQCEIVSCLTHPLKWKFPFKKLYLGYNKSLKTGNDLNNKIAQTDTKMYLGDHSLGWRSGREHILEEAEILSAWKMRFDGTLLSANRFLCINVS